MDCRLGSDRRQTAIWRLPFLQRQALEDIRCCVGPMLAAAFESTANKPLQTSSRGLLVLAKFPTSDEELIQSAQADSSERLRAPGARSKLDLMEFLLHQVCVTSFQPCRSQGVRR